MERGIKLPEPRGKGPMSIEEALSERRSVRSYRSDPLDLGHVSQLLWAGDGLNHHRRTSPSAGATYPLEVYLAVGEVVGLDSGVYHYSPFAHYLERIGERDIRAALAQAAFGQGMIQKAPMSIIIAATYERTTLHYGERGIRYVHMEAGHVGQNISLQAIALGLATVMVGAFDDNRIKAALNIQEEPLYVIPVGK